MDAGQVMQINNFASQALTARSAQANAQSGPPEFTRRKNWSQNVLEALRDVVHVLSSDLKILYCSPASREFLGYQPGELMGRTFTEFLHVDDVDLFSREFQTSQANGSILRATYRFLRKDGKYTSLETRGHFFKSGFFGSARSVPAEMTRTMDSFLDYKMENEMLKRQLLLAKKAKKHAQEPSPQTSESTLSLEDEYDGFEEDFEQLFAAVSNPNVYTQGVLNSFGAAESVNLFTGLNFDLGERSRGISMGLEGELFNTLVPTEVGDESLNETDKLKVGKKRRGDDEQSRICTDCGRTDAPEWRKGPRGPKT
ncbi:blue light receptor [Rhizopus stolonifer]|uniref:Blue light receptor n=1 Tax=Rhizopus stolonifer TaxID=4846 RepID=A0A367JCP4_RHIST|nr:blue light receptor [Rhizopus stolonifer]